MNSKSTTTKVAQQYRLRECASQVNDCQARPAGLKITDWCTQNGIAKVIYYYRLRRVGEAYLDAMSDTVLTTPIVVVPEKVMAQPFNTTVTVGLNISLGDCTIRVTAHSSMELLSSVLQVITHVK